MASRGRPPRRWRASRSDGKLVDRVDDEPEPIDFARLRPSLRAASPQMRAPRESAGAALRGRIAGSGAPKRLRTGDRAGADSNHRRNNLRLVPRLRELIRRHGSLRRDARGARGLRRGAHRGHRMHADVERARVHDDGRQCVRLHRRRERRFGAPERVPVGAHSLRGHARCAAERMRAPGVSAGVRRARELDEDVRDERGGPVEGGLRVHVGGGALARRRARGRGQTVTLRRRAASVVVTGAFPQTSVIIRGVDLLRRGLVMNLRSRRSPLARPPRSPCRRPDPSAVSPRPARL